MPWIGNFTETDVQHKLDGPMPWIGKYVAAASILCSLAMAADAFLGLRNKRFWFPCRFFSLNATSLTLLAVAMKLPVDLTTHMWAVRDRFAKVSSLILMSTAMANFMTSLGSMTDKEILMNLTALVILVATIIGDVWIQLFQMRSFLRGQKFLTEEMLATGFIFLLLLLLISSAIMVLTTKRYLETKYQELHKDSSNEELFKTRGLTIDNLRVVIKRYWVMAESSNPQFVVARSATCAASGVLCLLIALILIQALIRTSTEHIDRSANASSYGCSTNLIFVTQTIGVMVGTIAPMFRWFIAVILRCSRRSKKSFRDELIIEPYWTERLVEWKGSPLPLQIIQHHKFRKVLYQLKVTILNLCIGVQIVIVLASKLVLQMSVCLIIPIFSCFNYIKSLKNERVSDPISSDDAPVSEPSANSQVDFSNHALRLQGEVQLPKRILDNICADVDKVIQKGRLRQPRSLLDIVRRSRDFNGVRRFDSNQVASLHSKELPYCWSVPVMILTSIAIALPQGANHNLRQLVYGISEGLFFVNLIEKCLYRDGYLQNIRKVADIWVQVELYQKWQEMDLHDLSMRIRNPRDTLQELADEAERTVVEFKRDVKDCLMRNPLNWPVNVIAANSMYRISQTLLLACEGDDQTSEGLLNLVSTMIADILAACLTNLTRVISMKCHLNSIEEREKSVQEAAFLLGQTQEILELLQGRDLPSLSGDRAAYIEEWRTAMEQEYDIELGSASTSSYRTLTSESSGENVVTAIEV